MFNGIIETAGFIRILEQTGKGGARLVVDAHVLAGRLKTGDSLAVDGVCLTVVHKLRRDVWLDVSPETLSRTNLRFRKAGDRVNLERSLNLASPINGHFVQGHVEGIAHVRKWINEDDNVRLFVEIPSDLLQYSIPKGSIALNGVSLTIASLKGKTVGVALIPFTLKVTNLGDLKVGDPVNVETDILGRYVVTTVKKSYHSLKLK